MYTSSDTSHRWLARPPRRRQSTVAFVIQTFGLIAVLAALIELSRVI